MPWGSRGLSWIGQFVRPEMAIRCGCGRIDWQSLSHRIVSDGGAPRSRRRHSVSRLTTTGGSGGGGCGRVNLMQPTRSLGWHPPGRSRSLRGACRGMSLPTSHCRVIPFRDCRRTDSGRPNLSIAPERSASGMSFQPMGMTTPFGPTVIRTGPTPDRLVDLRSGW